MKVDYISYIKLVGATVFLFSAGICLTFGVTNGQSFFLGSLVCFLPVWFFYYINMRVSNVRADGILKKLYLSYIVKIFVSALIFVSILFYIDVNVEIYVLSYLLGNVYRMFELFCFDIVGLTS